MNANRGSPEVSVAAQLRTCLEQSLSPTILAIEDESARHRGHVGSRPEGETHFRIVVVSAAFIGQTRIERQRLVHAAAAELLKERIHALTIRALTPAEAAAADVRADA